MEHKKSNKYYAYNYAVNSVKHLYFKKGETAENIASLLKISVSRVKRIIEDSKSEISLTE